MNEENVLFGLVMLIFAFWVSIVIAVIKGIAKINKLLKEEE